MFFRRLQPQAEVGFEKLFNIDFDQRSVHVKQNCVPFTFHRPTLLFAILDTRRHLGIYIKEIIYLGGEPLFFVFRISRKRLMVVGLLALALLAGVVSGPLVRTTAGAARLIPVYSIDTKEKVVALTFDISWG